jgi:nucleotide-binding universal stress UspA family protein
MSDHRIVVGVDGSDGGRRALQWAVHEAAARGGTVQAVISWNWADVDLPVDERAHAERIIADEIRALAGGAGVTIAAEAVEGRAADVLCAAARNADLLVLGSHGHSRVRHTVLGSVSEECVRKAPCPVVVIPVPVQQSTRTSEPAVPSENRRQVT